MYLLPNVMMLSGCLYGIHQNVYGLLIPEDKRIILFDSGLEEIDLRQIERTLKQWHLEDYSVSDTFLTHCHFDHAGNAHYFENRGSRIYIGDKDADSIVNGDEHTLTYCYMRQFPTCNNIIKVFNDDEIKLSASIKVKVYHTPGHTKGSVCYGVNCYNMQILFCGDFVQPGEVPGTVQIGIKVDSDYNYLEYLQSAKRMKDLEFDYIFSGHFQPDITNGKYILKKAYRELLVNRSKYY